MTVQLKESNTAIIRQQWISVSRLSGFFLTWLLRAEN